MSYPIIASSKCTDQEAWKALKQAQGQAEKDWNRPVYHYCPPSQWMNDPNGGICHDGWYHLFYLQDPFSAEGFSAAIMPDGTILKGEEKPNRFWAHIRSRDLVKWEPLPFALRPDRDNNEIKPISGSVIERTDGTHALFFTSVRYKKEKYDQCMAISRDGLISWERLERPVLAMPDDPEIEQSWRDPYVFQYNGEYYLVVAAATKSEALLLLYQAKGEDLIQWNYRGILLSKPRENVYYFECPRLFVMGKEILLIFSPYGNVKYYLCDFIPEECSLMVRREGLIDYGSVAYATQPIETKKGEFALLSWAPGWFSPNLVTFENWNGCLCTPRRITISEEGKLLQKPMTGMIGQSCDYIEASIKADSMEWLIPAAFEMHLHCDHAEKLRFRLLFMEGCSDRLLQEIAVSNGKITVEKATFQYENGILDIRSLCDHFLWEYFLQDGEFCYTTHLPNTPQRIRMVLKAETEGLKLDSLKVWLIKNKEVPAE